MKMRERKRKKKSRTSELIGLEGVGPQVTNVQTIEVGHPIVERHPEFAVRFERQAQFLAFLIWHILPFTGSVRLI